MGSCGSPIELDDDVTLMFPSLKMARLVNRKKYTEVPAFVQWEKKKIATWKFTSTSSSMQISEHLNSLSKSHPQTSLCLLLLLTRLHQENVRVVFGHLWDLWKDLKISKTWRADIFWETGTNSSREPVIFKRHLRIFQIWIHSFVKIIFDYTWNLYKSFNNTYHTPYALKSILF